MYTKYLNEEELERYHKIEELLKTGDASYAFARAVATRALAGYIVTAAEGADINSIEEDACELADGWGP